MLGRHGLLLALAVRLLVPCYADKGGLLGWSRTWLAKAEYQETEKEKHERKRARCHAITECYCIRHTVHEMNDNCGWCESSERALFGNEDGPDADEGTCAHWIFRSRRCPTLWCSEDATFLWYTSIVFPLLVVGGAAYFTHSHPDRPRLPLKPQFVLLRRSKEEFKKGLWGLRAKAPGGTFQRYFNVPVGWCSPLRGMWRGAGSSLAKVAGQVTLFGVYSCVFNISLKILPVMVDRLQWNIMCEVLMEVQRLANVLSMIVGFLFSFYALGRVSWWWGAMDYARQIQGRSHDLAMLLGGVAGVNQPPCGVEGWADAKWTFYRFEMLIFTLGFRTLSPCFAQISYGDLEEMGVLEPSERKILEQSIHPRKVVMKWLAIWIEYHITDMTVRSLMLDKLCGLRGAIGALHDQVEQRAPWSLEAILYAAVNLWILTIPFARADGIADRTVIAAMMPVMPIATNMLACSFYLSMLQLLEAFKEPFGISRDAMDPEVLLLETETSIVDFMMSPVPECLESICKDDLYCETDTGPSVTVVKTRSTFEIEEPHAARCSSSVVR